MAGRIEDYALIGDLHTAALVGRDGSIDWLCLPRFDSPSTFAALLGGEDNGRWLLAPTGEVTATRRRYRGDTLVLETDFETATGAVRVTDAMPPRDAVVDVVRVVQGLRGRVEMQMRWAVRFAYGSAVPWVRRTRDLRGQDAIVAVAGPDAVCLRGDVLPRATDDRVHSATFTVGAGDTLGWSMAWYPSTEDAPQLRRPTALLEVTEAFWREWSDRCTFTGPYREAVLRSLLTLKALIYEPTGGITAAPTTSLPEEMGGDRNWDYRYCWLRDATLSLWALLESGYQEEARRWRRWLLRAVAGDPAALQIVYGLAGERHLPELPLHWLDGYEGSRPVRIGNAAAGQFQLDVYGEVVNALAQARAAGLRDDDFSWSVQRALLGFLEENWHRPDRSLWEVRGPERPFTHSKVMAWVAFDRAVRAVEEHGLDGPARRWAATRDEIRTQVLREGFDGGRGTFTQTYGGREVDAALLMLPLVGFLPATDERMTGTIAAVEADLRDGDVVYRYRTHRERESVDGLSGREGGFLACSFWLVDNYARAGRLAEAERLFARLLALRNDVGLLAEEYDPHARRMTGNMPQAFSHLALVNAAQTLAGRGRPPAQRSG